ncbi:MULTISPECIES: alkaline phosphatase family protein [unclassified Candidatus Frackibacter]|uniref:alkaline phosphatase family protein n=1 Tax=unclassified Candidatus Frackibacter TaxID=2648818 RepID=UPI00088F09C2|nr:MULTISPECIES: alkaline phosphatase family protein [unclassified Candidatus Frackibacter]SDC11387.1 Metalloenzyme superfamily protein [Candidatus Frackibacter sp. WG11]SEM36518.1 Metalloenzyme superfamily protein [Candidatus Frackibacter sp. WG12]SFL41807.1 Metalloenzyme superfamily protein [Candidatus Frackibacter sp. WG13]
MPKVIMVFIDGFGLGENSSTTNPLVTAETPGFNYMLGGNDLIADIGRCDSKLASLIPTDASLGVEGLPQSATGQTAILTGVNASQKLERHISGFPTPTLKEIIKEESVFKKISNLGLKPHFINTYTREYFQKQVESKRYAATTLAVMAGGIEFNYVDKELLAGKSIYHDLKQEVLIERGFNLPLITSHDSAIRLYNVIDKYDFILFEYFLSDVVGHKQDLKEAIKVVEDLDEFIFTLIKRINLEEVLLVITSDHGNIEDLSVRTHTKNLVPTILVGAYKDQIKDRITSLTDLTPAIISLFQS